MTKEEVLKEIEAESKRLSDDLLRAGWNAKIIIFGIASLIWLLIGELEKSNNVVWEKISLFYLLISSLYILLTWMVSTLEGNEQSTRKTAFKVGNRISFVQRTNLAIHCLNIGLLAYIGFLNFELGPQMWVIFVFYAILFLLGLVFLILHYFPLPILSAGDSSASKRRWVWKFINIVLLFLFLFSVVTVARDAQLSKDLYHLRVAGIIFAICGLLLSLSRLRLVDANLRSVSRIRQNLTWDIIDVETSYRELRILTDGATVDEVLGEPLSVFLNVMSIQNHLINEIQLNFKLTLTTLDGEVTPDCARTAFALVEANAGLISKLLETNTDRDRAVQRVLMFMELFSKASWATRKELEGVQNRIRHELTSHRAKASEVQDTQKELKSRIRNIQNRIN